MIRGEPREAEKKPLPLPPPPPLVADGRTMKSIKGLEDLMRDS